MSSNRFELLASEDRLTASRTAACRIAGALNRDLFQVETASVVVSGGSTPMRCYEILSHLVGDWSQVTVLLSDERWVPATDSASNERLLREHLLQNRAATARLLPSYRPGLTPEQAVTDIDAELAAWPHPHSQVLLGMGEDGHFASLFPDYANLAEALDPNGAAHCVLVRTEASPHPRISLTLRALMNAHSILLLAFGESKLAVLEAARRGDERYPITHLLARATVPVTCCWAP